MALIAEGEYLTIAEAATLLTVHKSTIRRWIDQGILPAYRVGQRRVALRRSDLLKLITPARVGPRKEGMEPPTEIDKDRTLTLEEQQRGLAAVAELVRLQQEIAAKYDRRLGTESWDLLNEARDERSRQLS